MERKALTKEDWIRAGMAALRAGGPGAVRIEPLARSLGATKGSFYWHFKDQRALVEAIWRAWQAQALARLAGPAAPPVPAARHLMQWIRGDEERPCATEAALRSWALGEPVLARMLREVDVARIHALAEVLRATGVKRAGQAAQLLHAARLGLAALGTGGTAERRALVAMVTSEAGQEPLGFG